MPGSFLARHRTICATLYELQDRLKAAPVIDAPSLELVEECLLYARRMSLKLTEYKMEKEKASLEIKLDK